jgi:hypothetical protein
MDAGGAAVTSPNPLPGNFNQIEPTGLDFHAAYWALYPGVARSGGRVHELNDQALRMVEKGARMRRVERDRVKAAALELAEKAAAGDLEFLSPGDQAALIRSAIEEIR